MVGFHSRFCSYKNFRSFKLVFSRLNAHELQSALFLSPHVTVTPALLSLLSRSPSFVPTPPSCSHSSAFAYVLDFVRRLQWKSVFSQQSFDGSAPARFGPSPSSAWPPPGRIPRGILCVSRRIISAARSILGSSHCCFRGQNLLPDEREALDLLASDHRVTVRPADKGGRWVLMDSTDYSNECHRQLQDTSFYRVLSSPLPVTTVDPTSILVDLQSTGHITKRELRSLLPPTIPKSRTFSILPKIHKSVWPAPNMPPGRPIVADVDSVNSGAARLLDHFLQPLVRNQDSYLRDSHHLIAILRPLRLSDSSILATFDVRSLYTNVPIEEGIMRVQRAFRNFPDPRRPDEQLLRLLRTSLLAHDFRLEEHTWLQVKGVAMGKAFGGCFASLYLGEWETLALRTSPQRPTLWRRFQDDILVVWDHGHDALVSFLEHLNALDPHIIVDLTCNADKIRFLDLEIYRAPGGLFGHRIGFKDTDCHQLLPRDSLHASHVHRGVVYSQILRWVTLSSTHDDFLDTCRTVFPSWRLQGISRSLIRQCISRVFSLTNLRPLWSFGFSRCEGQRCRACHYAAPSSCFKDPRSSLVYPILGHFTCDSSHCIYVIYCSHCFFLYVGQTSNAVRVRINEHLRSLSSPTPSSLLASHFSQSCSPTFFRWVVLDRCFSKERRLEKEARWIRIFRSQHPHGLNREAGTSSTKANLVTFPAECTGRLNALIRNLCRRRANTDVRLCYTNRTRPNLVSLLRNG